MNKIKILWGIIFVLLLLQVSTLAYFQNNEQSIIQTASQSNKEANANATELDLLQNEPYAAQVKDQVITMEEFVQRLIKDYGDQVLDDMINRTLIFAEAEQLGITIPEGDIEREMEELRRGYANEEEFFQEIENQIGIGPEDLRAEIEYYLLLEEIATKDVVITPEQISTYYAENEDQFVVPTRFHMHQIVVESEEEAEQVVEEISQGSSFEAVAAERSLDLVTSSNGGDMGLVTADDYFLTEEMKQVAESIAINELSDPIAVDEGYAIIKVTERHEGGQQTLASVEGKIRRELALEQIDGLSMFLEHLREHAKIIKYVNKE